MLTRLLLFVALSVWPALATAQDTAIHTATPEGSRLPGCRVTLLLGEALVGPDHQHFLVLWNPLPVDQRVEVQIFDDGSASPRFDITPVPAMSRVYKDWLNSRGPRLSSFRAVSYAVRWEQGGEAHAVTWRVPVWTPLTFDWVSWLRQWRVELVSPVQRETICYQ